MESTLTRQTYFDITLLDDKHFFAPFFNQARHNAFTILNIITEVMRLDSSSESKVEEGKLWKSSKVIEELLNGDPRKQQGIIELLDRWMPFVIIKNRNNPEEVGKRLKAYLWLLNNYRNYFSHYFHKPFDFPFSPEEFHGFGVEKDEKDFRFEQNLEREFKSFWEKSTMLLDKHFATVFSHSDKVHLNKLVFAKDKGTFTKNGLLYFVCLFLEIDDVNKLLSRTKYFKGTQTNKMRATREAFARLACKLPRPKVHSTDEKQALLLDMLNELAKAPKGVYDHMLEDQKAKLFIDIQEEFSELENGEEDFRRIEMRRKRDRFPYFALKFLEVTNQLPNILFHLSLGKRLVKPVYTKEILNQQEERRLTKEILTFGRLKDFRDGPNLYPKHIINSGGINRNHEAILHLEYPLEQFRPKYHFSKERIGIRFKTPGLPPDSISIPDLEKYEPLMPELFISLNDLPKLIMMSLTHSDKEVEEFLRNKIANKTKFYDDIISGRVKPSAEKEPIKKGLSQSNAEQLELQERFDRLARLVKNEYALTLAQIPEKVRDFLVKQSHNSLQVIILRKMQQALDDANDKVSNSKSDTLNRKKGELATLIARDMVKFFKPMEDTKRGKKRVKKLNSTQYQLLQSKLAYFGVSKDALLKLCDEFDIFQRHPFVTKSLFKDVKIKGKMQPIGIKKFFRNYFDAKATWIEKQIILLQSKKFSVEHLRQNYYMFELYHQEIDDAGLYKASFIADYLRKIKAMPFYLARNSFDAFLPYEQGDNFVKWMEKRANNALQWFYKDEILLEESNIKQKHARDKKNRHSLTKDRIIWEMAKSIGGKEMEITMGEVSLNDYGEITANILEVVIDVRLTIKTEERHIKLERTITAPIKVKDYGSLRKYLKDRRLHGLFSYYPEGDDIPLDTIKTELKKYENERHVVLKDVFEIEQAIYAAKKSEFNGSFLVFSKQLAFFQNESNPIWNKSNRQEISKYRNHYLHNKIPKDVPISFKESKVVELVNSEVKRKFAEMLADFSS